MNAAQAQLNQATTAVNLAAKEEVRYRELLQAEAISASLYDSYKSRLDDALAAQALQSQLDSANLNLHETEIHAPFDGIITNKYVEEGSLISSSVPLYSLQDRMDNWVDFKIKETEINNFAVGDKIQMQGRNDSVKLDGTVESIRRKADFATQKATSERGDVDIIAFNLKVRTNNEQIYPGMRFKLLR